MSRTEREEASQPGRKEKTMARKYLDCRDCPVDIKCTVALSAESEDELLDAAVLLVGSHGYKNAEGLRDKLRSAIKYGAPAV
jgi:hypothetical protein